MKIPCPHFDIEIVSRGKGRSVIAAAAYQSGETLFSQYTGTWESGDHEEGIVHKDNKAVRMINSLFSAIKRKLKDLRSWLKGTAEIIADHEKLESPYDYPITDVLMAYVDLRTKEREGWYHGAQTKGHIRDLSETMRAPSVPGPAVT